ncbi:proton-translocating NADH-quinone oxidoreductase, chain N [Flammeovirgaceae bacterium 311]|nr:proton-translocating NADH-quinone oxidoreductase, chain N [Flammeovirgaceae bacterium 311]
METQAPTITPLKAILQAILQDLPLLYPELTIGLGVLLVLLGALLLPRNWRNEGLAALSLLVIAASAWLLLYRGLPAEPVHLLARTLQLDRMAVAFRLLVLLSGLLAVLLSFREGKRLSGEYYALLLGLLMGAMLMSMASHLLLIYLSLETASICAYLLTAFSGSRSGAEAGLKYLLFGAVASAIMLYGMSLLYGFTGTLDITAYGFKSGLMSLNIPILPVLLAAFLVLAGFLFKISVVPFHLWTPDAYEGAPLPAAALFSTAPKLAGLALIMRFLSHFLEAGIIFAGLRFDWQFILGLLAIITMLVGNLAAVWQQDARRLLAYSSIAHSGLLLAAVLVFRPLGYKALLFYSFVYILMNFAAFLLVIMLKTETGSYRIADYKGLGSRLSYSSVLMVVVMIALTGLPPTAGFTAKLLVFSALWEGYSSGGSSMLLYLLLTGLATTVVALFYYLKIPYYLYLKKQSEEVAAVKESTVSERILAGALALLLVLFFFRADWVMNWIEAFTISQ